MRMNVRKNAIAALVILFSAIGFESRALAASPSAEEIVAQHLDSIANTATRAGLKTRLVQAPVRFTILNASAGALDGKAVLVSDGKKFQFMVKLPNNDYRGEQFIFDGEKDKVAFSTARNTRSGLGNLVFVQDTVLREGLLGGVLTTGWALLNLDERKAKLTVEGLRKVDGEEVYDVRYRPHKSSDLEIHLYFDPQTHRHVETVYSYSVSQGLTRTDALTAGMNSGPASKDNGAGFGDPGPVGGNSTSETAQARQQQNRVRLQEKFSDFKTVDGVTLPTHYNIQLSQELQNGRTTLSEWDVTGMEVSSNVPVDARNFEVK